MASNISDSYEKVVLVVALVIALALGGLAFTSGGKIEEDFVQPSPTRRPAPELPGKGKMDIAIASLGKPVQYERGKEGGREVDTFVGIPWFLKKDGSTVDLGDASQQDVHKGIPNIWWLDNHLNPGFADSPEQDADDDGFSNREEFVAKTDPNAPSDHPPLIDKLLVKELINDKFLLDFSGDIGTSYKMKTETKINGRIEKGTTKDYIPAGEGDASVFFSGPPFQFRFRLKAVEERVVVNERTNVESKEKFAIVEDLKPNLKGNVYEIPYGGQGLVFNDYKVVLYLDAIGEEGNKFEVPINTSFSLPYKEDAADKPFTFKGLSAAGDVMITYQTDGQPDQKDLVIPEK
jgi:hypothetical protein